MLRLTIVTSAVAVAVVDPLVVTLEGLGSVRGAAVGADVRAFHGVPYATSPTGAARWAAPAAHAPWSGVRDGRPFAAACAQSSGFTPTITNTSEDCLTMSWYAPAGANGKNPVVAWIHGGGFGNGGADEARLNGSAAIAALKASGVEDGDLPVIAVVQYRLGVFGFAGSDGLRDSSTNSTGNWGFLDQRAAISFVARHAAAFGGDGANAAIAGQSAGAASVGNHVVSPRTPRGLFRRAIGMSGAFSDWAAVSLADQQNAFSSLLGQAGCETAACARALSPGDLLSAYGAVGCPACFEPTVDGVEFPANPGELLATNGVPAGVAVLAGNTRDEANTFDAGNELDPTAATAKTVTAWAASEYALTASAASSLLETHYPAADYAGRGSATKNYLRAVALETDQDMRCASRRGAANATQKSYVYQFDRGIGGTNFANHADDIPSANRRRRQRFRFEKKK